jgi:beta-lactamase regulating signal transducer with metallopeptidase domain
MELSADESVIRALDEDERADYARSLVDHVERGAVFSSAFGGAALRGRLENIINYKEMTKLSAVCVVLFAILLAVVLITNAI